ncbi:MAG: cation transporter [Ignavibacteriaceae bacterium]|nr:cation transporter [Ignavibacteriaceae bacterium]
MKTQEFRIDGMSCGHCVMAVRKELTKLENVKVDDVQIGKAKVEYDESKISEDRIINAIEEAGYKVLA